MQGISKTAQVLRFFAQQYGPGGIPRKRLVKLAFMADVLARQYLGHPVTQLVYIKDHWGPNAPDLPQYTKELVDAECADETTHRDGTVRKIVLRATGRATPVDFTLGESEVLAYVAKNYAAMDLAEFIEHVVKETDPAKLVEREGEELPMHIIDNTARNEIGFDLERVAQAERQAEAGDYITLAQFADELRAPAPA